VNADRLVAIDLSTRAQTQLAEVGSGQDILAAEWSPDGGRVAYRLGLGNPTGSSEACVVDVATQQQKCFSGLGDVYTLHWAPDGVHLIVVGPGQGIDNVAIDTGEVTTLVPAEGSPTVTAALQQAA
jgi:Tol biopolymer transport system component